VNEESLLPGDTSQFERLVTAVQEIANRASFPLVVEPRPLDGTAKDAVRAYGVIARSLRTIFEPATTTAVQ